MLTAGQVDQHRHAGHLGPLPALSPGEFAGLESVEGWLGAAELERCERVYRRHRENYAEKTEWHERGFAPTGRLRWR